MVNLYLGGIQIQIESKVWRKKGSSIIPFSNFTEGKSEFNFIENSQNLNLQIRKNKIDDELKKKWKESRLILDSESTWCLKKTSQAYFKESGFRYLMAPSPKIHPELTFCLLMASENFENIKIIYGEWENNNASTWMFYPYEQNIFVHLLQFSKEAALCHASGIEIEGKGYLFVGGTGVGKSTIATLLEEKLGPGRIFSDDRIVIRNIGGQWNMYGTPWHGEIARIKNAAIPIGGLFFIEKSSKHYLANQNSAEKVRLLLSTIFGAWWLPDRIDEHLEFIRKVTDQVQFPLLKFGFAPESSIADFLLTAIANNFSNVTFESARVKRN